MEDKWQQRFGIGGQSSLAPERKNDDVVVSGGEEEEEEGEGIVDPGVSLMYMANEGDVEGILEALDSGTDVNFCDIVGRTALHVAACQGQGDVVELLLRRGAVVDAKDRWGSTPLAEAIFYKNNDVIKLLEAHGAKPRVSFMHVQNVRAVPEYEIDPLELDFSNSINITKGTFYIASWRGTQVAVKSLGEELFTDEDKLKAFRDELALLQKLRHPHAVQFLGAVTQSSPMMIVMEYLPKGDLCALLRRKGALKLTKAVRFALHIARGMNYLHEHKPEAIIHGDLEPSNILRDNSGHLKVADFGLSKLVMVANTIKKDKPDGCQDISWRYLAPEVLKNEEYDTKVDVFSFALILQEMIEGCPPFSEKQEIDVPKLYLANERPPFRASRKLYAHGLRELIEECWNDKPFKRPTFRQIIWRLDAINSNIIRGKWRKSMEAKWQQRFCIGVQSSLAPERKNDDVVVSRGEEEEGKGIVVPGVSLLYMVNEGNVEGVLEALDSGTDVNFHDVVGRTALHIAACQGQGDVVELLLRRGAVVDVKDHWGRTPLAGAIFYKNNDVIKLLDTHRTKPRMALMHLQNDGEVLDCEIDPLELDFTNIIEITKGTFYIASWCGTQVAVKILAEELFTDEDKLKAFRDELALLQKFGHPNVVQFLGAVTQSSPMMIVTEYLPQGDLCTLLRREGALKPTTAVKFALDIARGMNYLHEHKPEAIIHRDLEPSNILRDDSGHLKVADFGLSKLVTVASTIKEDKPDGCQEISWRYLAPEVLKNEEYDTKVDVFSFALILQEMIEGCPPFSEKQEIEVPKLYVANERPPFRASGKLYAHGLRELIKMCWNDKPFQRPTFRQIISRLEDIYSHFSREKKLKAKALERLKDLQEILKKDFSISKGWSARSTISTRK